MSLSDTPTGTAPPPRTSRRVSPARPRGEGEAERDGHTLVLPRRVARLKKRRRAKRERQSSERLALLKGRYGREGGRQASDLSLHNHTETQTQTDTLQGPSHTGLLPTPTYARVRACVHTHTLSLMGPTLPCPRPGPLGTLIQIHTLLSKSKQTELRVCRHPRLERGHKAHLCVCFSRA